MIYDWKTAMRSMINICNVNQKLAQKNWTFLQQISSFLQKARLT